MTTTTPSSPVPAESSAQSADQFIEVATSGDAIKLCYQRTGDPAGPPLVMIMGLGAQLAAWPPEFVAGFGDRGFDVVTFDNRDIGRSAHFDEQGPTAEDLRAGFEAGALPDLPYSLANMAADVAGLIHALELGPAHVLGVSMGGMIAQQVAIDHPDAVASLTSIMSTTGSPDVGAATPEAMEAITRPAPTGRDASIEATVEAAKVWASPEWFDEDSVRARVVAAWDRRRELEPDGIMRQMGAILTGGSREPGLAELNCPTLVIHGDADPLVTPSGGQRTAEVTPGAELLMLEGMGHDLPPIHWQAMTEAVLGLVRRAES